MPKVPPWADPDGGAFGTDGGTGSAGIRLEVLRTALLGGYFDLDFRVTNVSEQSPIPVSPSLFSVEDTRQNLHQATGGICQGGEALAAGGSQVCELQFSVPAGFSPKQLRYADPGGRTATAGLTPEASGPSCTSSPEDSLSACSDGCSNDGDPFVDCDDFDCCGARTDCPSDSPCGRMVSCTSGPENTVAMCSDGCSNDGDRFVDCDDFDCCDARTDCPIGTACAR